MSSTVAAMGARLCYPRSTNRALVAAGLPGLRSVAVAVEPIASAHAALAPTAAFRRRAPRKPRVNLADECAIGPKRIARRPSCRRSVSWPVRKTGCLRNRLREEAHATR
jgi:hypothetical protein